jgi:hypothetical protein
MIRFRAVCAVSLFALSAAAQTAPAPPPGTLLEDPFRLGAILVDTNGDKLADALCGHILVPKSPSVADNTSAANLAARLGFETSALTLPIVVSAPTPSGKFCPAGTPDLFVGRESLPAAAPAVDPLLAELQIGEGGVFAVPGGILIAAPDASGLIAAADFYSAHAPFQASVTGERLQAIARTVNARLTAQKVDASVTLVALTYTSAQPGLHRAVLLVAGSATPAAIRAALVPAEGETPLRGIAARELQLRFASAAPLTLVIAGARTSAGAPAAAAAPAGAGPAAEARLLDLKDIYGIHGLLSGTPKMLVPESVPTRLYVPAGEPGVAMANLAARLGLETTGITLPIAFPDTGVTPAQVTTAAVITGATPLTVQAADLLGAPGGTALDTILPGQFSAQPSQQLPALKPGEGELAVVDRAFGTNPALLVRGDAPGSAAALTYASDHLPYLWEPTKKFAGLDEMRFDLDTFFSMRSSTGQATAGLYNLDQWLTELAASKKKFTSVSAELDVDEADPKLQKFLHDKIAAALHPAHLEVKTGSLHAGLKCCDAAPDLHRISDVIPFKQAEPTFSEDIVIPWEGKHLYEVVRKAAASLPKGAPVTLEARVSEGPEERVKIKQQLTEMLKAAGADPGKLDIKVLCTYKSGYSWLIDEIEPALKGTSVAKIKIEYAPYPDPTRQSTMRSLYRWNQELFPVDEILARDLSLPLKSIDIAMMPGDTDPAKGPTYKVHAYSADGKELLTRDFTVKTVSRPYSDQFPEYETVTVETGWVTLTAAGKTLADERIESDIETFWDHYQAVTLPKIYKLILAQNDGKPRTEFQPLFDTLRVTAKMSEPDYKLGLEEEQISSLEGLQEDTFFNTENFFYMLGDLVAGGRMDYQGRILPVIYPTRDGQDGEVHIEFYAKDAGSPKVRLAWKTEGDPVEHERLRDLPVVASAGHSRLVSARVAAGKEGVESLTWRMPVDFAKDNFKDWIVLAEKSRVERTVVSAEQEIGQVEWLSKLHAAGLYLNEMNYPHLASLGFQFEVPVPILVDGKPAPEHAKKEILTTQLAVSTPPAKRPMISDFTPTPLMASGRFVQWDNPIAPAEEEHLLSRLATYPGVDVYWMGRTYLGRDIWAADMTLPTPSTLSSMAKATTEKASIIYSGRQHANEVSSTSHILRLAEELVLDPARRASLNQVNVVIHPITNVDGAELSIDLAKIAPKNMIHAGYHASLTADVVNAQNEEFPIYPESATRRLLWQAWLPDAFLNPHGYPTHEWVQPFSEYSGWITTRMGAETGRTNWVPRGWFTSLGYLADDEHPESRIFTYAMREKIVTEMAKAPGVLEMNAHENDRYARYQKDDEESYQQPIYKGVRINMALKGQGGRGAAGAGGAAVGIGGLMVRYPDITYDDGYTEAPDETAYGDFLKLVAGAGLAYDHAHLDYLTEGKLNVKHTQRDTAEGVAWKVERKRPIMPLPGLTLPPAEGVKP